MKANEPVRVWVATDKNGSQWLSREKPLWIDDDCGFDLHEPFTQLHKSIGVNVPPGECREYVMIPASEYQPGDTGELQRLRGEREELRSQVEAERMMVAVLEHRIKREQVSPRVRLIAEIAEGRITHGNYETFADAVNDAAKIVAETEAYVKENL